MNLFIQSTGIILRESRSGYCLFLHSQDTGSADINFQGILLEILKIIKVLQLLLSMKQQDPPV